MTLNINIVVKTKLFSVANAMTTNCAKPTVALSFTVTTLKYYFTKLYCTRFTSVVPITNDTCACSCTAVNRLVT